MKRIELEAKFNSFYNKTYQSAMTVSYTHLKSRAGLTVSIKIIAAGKNCRDLVGIAGLEPAK